MSRSDKRQRKLLRAQRRARREEKSNQFYIFLERQFSPRYLTPEVGLYWTRRKLRPLLGKAVELSLEGKRFVIARRRKVHPRDQWWFMHFEIIPRVPEDATCWIDRERDEWEHEKELHRRHGNVG